MRLHGLKMRREKRVAVLPLVQHAGSTCGEEGRIRHAEEAEDGSQVRLYKIERRHLRLGIVDAAGRDDESRLLADDQALRLSVRIGKGLADTRNLVDPELEHRGHSEVMHRHAEDVLIGLLEFGKQGIRKRKQLLLLWSARRFRGIHGSHPFGVDRRDLGCVKVAINDRSIRVGRLPLGNERTGKLARDGSPIQWARIDVKKRGHGSEFSYAAIDV